MTTPVPSTRVGPEWEIPLHMPRRNRAGDVILSLIVTFLAIFFIGGFAALVIGLFGNFWAYLVAAVLAAIALTVIGSAIQTVRRSTRRRVCLRLHPDELEIDHYLRFRRPFRIPKQRIKSVTVDVIHSPAPDLGEMVGAIGSAERKPRSRLPVIGLDRLDRATLEESTIGDYLYSASGSPLPLVVSELKDVPNLAVIFDEPVILATARGSFLSGGASWPTALGFLHLYLPNRKHPALGFLAQAVDAYKAYVTFDAWGVLPTSEATASQVVHVFPTRRELARETKIRAMTVVGLFVAALLIRFVGESLTS